MKTKLRLTAISAGLLASMLPAVTHAATFGSYDPRSLAMGGTGVSQANIDHAAYFNPALLSVAQDDDDFSLLIPTIGARIYDPKKLVDAVDEYQNGKYETTFNNAIDSFNTASTLAEKQTAASTAATSAQKLVDSFVKLSDKALDFEVHAGLGVAVPSKGLGFALTGSGRAMGGLVINVTPEDQTLLQKYVDTLNWVATSGASGTLHTDIYDTGTQTFIDPAGKLTSSATLRGIAVIEGGLSVAHEFESLDNWSIGITPKTVQVTTYDYKVGIENADFNSEAGKLNYDDVNVDVGLAKRLNENWKFGFVVKNAVKKDYKTVLGNTIELEPTARTGISHHTNWTTVALDVDMTENKSIGLTGEKTQYAALGMEFDLSLVQLRVGARHNMSAADGRASNLFSVGAGVYIFGFHVDAAYAKNEDEVAAAVQLGFQF